MIDKLPIDVSIETLDRLYKYHTEWEIKDGPGIPQTLEAVIVNMLDKLEPKPGMITTEAMCESWLRLLQKDSVIVMDRRATVPAFFVFDIETEMNFRKNNILYYLLNGEPAVKRTVHNAITIYPTGSNIDVLRKMIYNGCSEASIWFKLGHETRI